LERKRRTADDGGKTEIELVKKRGEKTIADSTWHSAEINKKEAIELEETKIKH
jgi:hypothetical protein